MTMIARDMLVGNPRLAELDWGEEALGHNAILVGSRASASGPTTSPTATSWKPCSTAPSIGMEFGSVYFATENDSLNGASCCLATC